MNPSSSPKKEKILIIEGNVAFGESMRNALQNLGYIVTVINNGTDGLKAIYDNLPHLIVLDLVLAGADAYDILQKKHDESMLSKIPVFILSTHGEPINMRRVPEGSVADFVITLDPNPTDIVNRINKHFGREAVVDQPKQTNAGKKVLWVEDDKLIGSILEKKFLSSGLNLFHAHNGEEAMNYIKDNAPDAFVLDLMLPGMDGFEILQKARMDQRFRHTPAMILSNLSKPSDLEKAKMLGASKFLVKASSSLDQIVAEVKALIQ